MSFFSERQLRENVNDGNIAEIGNARWEPAMQASRYTPYATLQWIKRCAPEVGVRNTQLFAMRHAYIPGYVYEIGVEVPTKGIVCVYVGKSKTGNRTNAYLCDGSHLNIPINAVIRQGLTIMMRKVHVPDPTEVERQCLERYDYAWNQKNQGRKLKRRDLVISFIL